MSLICLSDFQAPKQDTAVCLGTFDGVHKGHQALIKATLEAAEAQHFIPCAYTFDIPPARFFHQGSASLLTELPEKAELLQAYGIEQMVYSRFDRTLAALSPQEFFEEILLQRLNAKHLVIGFHYRFGCRAVGGADEMHTFCRKAGIGLTVIEPVRLQSGELISSTAIRALLQKGDVKAACEMLGHPLQCIPNAINNESGCTLFIR